MLFNGPCVKINWQEQCKYTKPDPLVSDAYYLGRAAKDKIQGIYDRYEKQFIDKEGNDIRLKGL